MPAHELTEGVRVAGHVGSEQLGRYQLLDLVTQDAGVGDRPDVYLWHAYDEVLDRAVAIRVLSDDDPRCAAVLGAAQAAAAVDDLALGAYQGGVRSVVVSG